MRGRKKQVDPKGPLAAAAIAKDVPPAGQEGDRVHGVLARDGDILTISYPEVRLQVADYNTVGIGGVSFQTTLREGEDVDAVYSMVTQWLNDRVMRDGKAKLAEIAAELRRAGVRTAKW